MSLDLVLDGVLAVSLAALCVGALRARDLFTGVVMFIVFGLLMAAAWVRLLAPDLALAEAAIGAGVTGALFLGALYRLEQLDAEPLRHLPSSSRLGRALLGAGAIGLAVLLLALVSGLAAPAPGLAREVESELDAAGARNPVTAVILNLRAYDTLLELAVLLVAWAGACVLQGELPPRRIVDRMDPPPILAALVRFIAPGVVVVAGYLVWVGGHAPGGAFQAGALLGGAGAIGLMSGVLPAARLRGALARPGLVAGVGVFLLAGLWTCGSGSFLEYRGATAKLVILAIELASAVSIGLVLTLLFAACSFRPTKQDAAPLREDAP